jgi:ABC-type glycerol-3-phosphate transport system permease component
VIVFAVLIGFPFVFMVSTSLKTFEEVFIVPMRVFPNALQWDNYLRVWEIVPLARFTLNSLIYTLSITGGEFILGAASGFAFAKLRFPGKKYLFFLVLISFMIPGEITLVPRFILLSKLQWINTYPGLIIPELSSAFTTFMLHEHFKSLSNEIFEAATVDGAGVFRQLWQIAIPISKPIVSSLLLLAFVAHWNAYLWPLVVTNSENMRTLPIGIQQIRSGLVLPEWQLVMAGTTLVVIPLIILFIFAQRQFLEGATQGALKG